MCGLCSIRFCRTEPRGCVGARFAHGAFSAARCRNDREHVLPLCMCRLFDGMLKIVFIFIQREQKDMSTKPNIVFPGQREVPARQTPPLWRNRDYLLLTG